MPKSLTNESGATKIIFFKLSLSNYELTDPATGKVCIIYGKGYLSPFQLVLSSLLRPVQQLLKWPIVLQTIKLSANCSCLYASFAAELSLISEFASPRTSMSSNVSSITRVDAIRGTRIV